MFWLLVAPLTQLAQAEAPAVDNGTHIESVLESTISIPSVRKNRTTDCESYRHLISQYDWDIDIAMAICSAESNGNETIVNWGDTHNGCVGSAGLFQIACIHRPIEEMQNAHKNIEQAYKIYQQSGWLPWGAYTNGSYKKYL